MISTQEAKLELLQSLPVDALKGAVNEVATVIGGYSAFFSPQGEILCSADRQEQKDEPEQGCPSGLAPRHLRRSCELCITRICSKTINMQEPVFYRCCMHTFHIAAAVVSTKGKCIGILYCTGEEPVSSRFVQDSAAFFGDFGIESESQSGVVTCTSPAKSYQPPGESYVGMVAKIIALKVKFIVRQLEIQNKKHALSHKSGLLEDAENEIIRMVSELNSVELKAVSSQIKPEFVFTAISAIYCKSILSGTEGMPTLLDEVSAMLRKLLGKADKILTLGDEVSFIEKYISVLSYDAKANTLVAIDVSEECNSVRLPQLTIFPFVDVLYDMLNKKAQGSIALKVRRIGRRVVISLLANHDFDVDFLTFAYRLRSIGSPIHSFFSDARLDKCELALVALRQFFKAGFSFNVATNTGQGFALQLHIPYDKI